METRSLELPKFVRNIPAIGLSHLRIGGSPWTQW